ncbi:hypothetical protein SISSUDRAFT_575992 [Sistotremastrum suecicum HHB10207 ss-3]|uniref:Uncharacterized protein n=1 Tax=Sistotremastrum suecicum HHB10207 ss-3 TaxID=1314776 RepID=A0A165XG02_9AGAM|nr:hypothetical protein SISSUDRAFT_575992 [Sistotremastrum suecicum HHB10207 ss-3]
MPAHPLLRYQESPMSTTPPNEVPPPQAAPAPDQFDTPIFHRLLNLIAEQTAAIKEQGATLSSHSEKLDTLVKDAMKGEVFVAAISLVSDRVDQMSSRTTKKQIHWRVNKCGAPFTRSPQRR